jgi:Ca2+-binding RTX toxin-like protein
MKTRTTRLRIEALEDRQMLSITLDSLGTLSVVGTSSAEGIRVEEVTEQVGSLPVYNGATGQWQMAPLYADFIKATRYAGLSQIVVETGKFAAADVLALSISGLGGSDNLENATDLPAMMLGGAGSDIVFGGSGADSIDGGSGDDVIFGNPGDDVIFGNFGNDTLYGVTGHDTLQGGAGKDYVYGDGGNDRLIADLVENESDLLAGGSGGDTYVFANPTVMAGPVDYWYTPSFSDPIIDDLSGVDTLDFSGHVNGIELYLRDTEWQEVSAYLNLQLKSAGSIENVVGSAYDDVLVGDSLANRLEGGQGADLLEGGAGNDTLNGGAGSDEYVFTQSAAAFSETFSQHTADTGGHGDNLGTDRIEEGALLSTDILNFRHADGGIDLDLSSTSTQAVMDGLSLILSSGTGIENVWGSAFDDEIEGNSRANTLRGFDGDDTLVGGDGNDVLEGGNNDDLLKGGNGRDTLRGQAGDDQLYSDMISGDDDNLDDLLDGGTGYDTGNDDGWLYFHPL